MTDPAPHSQPDLFPEDFDKPRVFRCMSGAFIGRFNRDGGTEGDPTVRLSAYLPSVAAAEEALAAGRWKPAEAELSWIGRAVFREDSRCEADRVGPQRLSSEALHPVLPPRRH
jgi:hypothetical protein